MPSETFFNSPAMATVEMAEAEVMDRCEEYTDNCRIVASGDFVCITRSTFPGPPGETAYDHTNNIHYWAMEEMEIFFTGKASQEAAGRACVSNHPNDGCHHDFTFCSDGSESNAWYDYPPTLDSPYW